MNEPSEDLIGFPGSLGLRAGDRLVVVKIREPAS
jgi:hypothetical protein